MARTDICAYVRVSTKDKEQLSSFENQMSYFQREFGENENYNLVQLYADCGRSGTSLKRPAFDTMIADAGVDKSHMDGDLFRIGRQAEVQPHTDKEHKPLCTKCQRRYAAENAA